MPRKQLVSGSAGLVAAALVVAGLAATPLTLASNGSVTANAAIAGLAPNYIPGGTEDIGDYYNTPLSILGITRSGPGNESGPAVNAASRRLADYERALRDGNLARASDDLATVSHRPITAKLVTDLNTKLGVQTPLADKQIAKVAAAKQSMNS
jgi:hypothetical protein